MKKTKLFSRIFAAALAAAITATTLVTNTGAGMLAFALEDEGDEGDNTTSEKKPNTVKIISPDVPADGSYTYKFYQIIGGDVEGDGAVNVLGNPEWGKAIVNMGDNVDFVGHYYYKSRNPFSFDETVTMTKSDVLFAMLNGNVYEQFASGQYNDVTVENLDEKTHNTKRTNKELYVNDKINKIMSYFKEDLITKLYGGTANSFGDKFVTEVISSNKRERTLEGLVDLLGKETINGASLKSFADLLYNGVEGKQKYYENGKDDTLEYVDLPNITFLDKNEVTAAQEVKSTDKKTEYIVSVFEEKDGKKVEVGFEPGYYLVACEETTTQQLTGEGYETTVKPLSLMLILVGPANDGVTEIVGKNAYTVPTVDLKIFHETVGLTDLSESDEGYENTNNDKFTKKLNLEETLTSDYTNDENWLTNVSFGNLQRKWNEGENAKYTIAGGTNISDYEEFVLYRISVTLPQNFEHYYKSGYFLALANSYDSQLKAAVSDTQCRPMVYVKKADQSDVSYIGNIVKNLNEFKSKTNNAIGYKDGSSNAPGGGNTYLTGSCSEIFYLDDLFQIKKPTTETEPETQADEETTTKPWLSGGDTIYIYYPAFYSSSTVVSKETRLIKTNKVWAVYSNNPYSEVKVKKDDGSFNAQNVNGDVAVSKISETNINTYTLKFDVDGETDFTAISDSPDYVLYRMNSENVREYAMLNNGRSSGAATCVGWFTMEKIKEMFSGWGGLDDKGEIATGNYPINGYYNLNFNLSDKNREIHGLAPGTYYIHELTIGSTNEGKSYKQAANDLLLTIGNTYNKEIGSFTTGNMAGVVQTLTVEFKQFVEDGKTEDRAIETEIVIPALGKGDKTKVTRTLTYEGNAIKEAATDDGIVEVKLTHKQIKFFWLPETGGIGTTIFFIVGGTIVVAATVLIVTRFRVKRERL